MDDVRLPALHTSAKVMAYVSQYEGFGLPVLEALACGAVVVARATAAAPEVAGDAAILVDPAREEAVAEGIAHAATDEGLRTKLDVAGPRRAATCTSSACAEGTIVAYRSALER